MMPDGNEQKSSSVFEDLPEPYATRIVRRVRLIFYLSYSSLQKK